MSCLSESSWNLITKLILSFADQDKVVRNINKMHVKLSGRSMTVLENKYSEVLWSTLLNYYDEAKKFAEEEEEILTKCIEDIEAQLSPSQALPQQRKKLASESKEASEGKRKRPKTEHDSRNSVPRLASPNVSPRMALESVASHTIIPGTQVAARISPDDAPKDDWIVVKVLGYDRETNIFEVVDEEPEDDEETGPRNYYLPPSCIIPLWKPGDFASAPEFHPGNPVLAVFPFTTSLYRATVHSKRAKRSDDYVLEFDGDEEEGVIGIPKKTVPFYYVVPLPENHRQ